MRLGLIAGCRRRSTLGSPAGLSAPTLRIVSALGTVPLTLGFDDADYIAGDYGQLEVASDSGFNTITQNLVFFIDGASWVLTDEAIGLANPAGPYWARIRIARDNDSGLTTVAGTDPLGNAISFPADVSAWSNVVNDTIGAQAALNTVDGVNKDSLLTVTGSPALSFSGTAANGNNSVRSTLQQGFSKAQFEITITSGAATGTTVAGIEDGTTNFNTTHGMPGLDSTAGVGSGIAVAFYSSGSTISIFDNAGGTRIDLTTAAGSVADNDTFTIVYDKVNNTLEVWRTRSGTTVQIGATQSVPALSAQWAYCGTRSSTSAGTMNFGSTAYAKAPGTGVAAFWA